jgi:hypothetical protein
VARSTRFAGCSRRYRRLSRRTCSRGSAGSITAEPGSVADYGGGLGIWGLKMGMDGGVEGGFLCEPYANNPAFRGHAFWEPDDFLQVVEHAVGRGWRVGCHAVGDCAVRRVLDSYEQVALRHPGLPPGTLDIWPPGASRPGSSSIYPAKRVKA